MSPEAIMRHARRGFTLIELLVVITIILLISGLMLNLPASNSGGLVGAQRMLGSSIRSLRAMALMNRGTYSNNITYNARYRLLILNDPSDPVNHLHQFVVAVGSVDSFSLSAGTDPTTITNTTDSNYKWYAPNAAMSLPNGVYFMPPLNDNTTSGNMPTDSSTNWSDQRNRSSIGSIADLTSGASPDNQASPPKMKFAAVNQPASLRSAPHSTDGKEWFYIELQSTGASNHLGKVTLKLANAALRPEGVNKMALDIVSENQFAAIVLRPNGDISMTSDADDMNANSLKK